MHTNFHEQWRLCHESHVTLTCTILRTSDAYMVIVKQGDDVVVSEPHRTWLDAITSAEAHRNHFINEGWSGHFNR